MQTHLNFTNFKLFYKSNEKLMTTNYPFLSRSQIKARLRTKWKKINEESKQKCKSKGKHNNNSLKTHNLDVSTKAYNINDEIGGHLEMGQVSFWKPANKWNHTFAGGVFRPNHKVPEVQFDEMSKYSKTSILKQNSSPAEKCKAGQVSFSSDVKKDSYTYDLSDEEEDENVYAEINNTRCSTQFNNQFATFCDEYKKLFHKTTNIQVGKDKQEHLNLEFPTKQPLNEFKLNRSLEKGREKEIFLDKLALKNKQPLYCKNNDQIDREESETLKNLVRLDVPISDTEMLDDDEKFNTFEEDEDDDVLLIRRDNSCTSGLEKDYDITEFNNETENIFEGKKSMMLFNKAETKMKVSHDNCKQPVELSNDKKEDLLQTPKCHAMISRKDSQKVQEKSNSLQNKPLKSDKMKTIQSSELTTSNDKKNLLQTPSCHSMILKSQKIQEKDTLKRPHMKSDKINTKPAKMTKRKDITSLLEEDIESKMERCFNAGTSVSHDDSHTIDKVQKDRNKRFSCRYSLQNCDPFSGDAETSKNTKVTPGNTSPDSSELREETPQSFFYSQQDAEETEASEERRPIINQMFEDHKTSNSLFTSKGKRLLASNAFQTSSNFSTMLFEDDEIFL